RFLGVDPNEYWTGKTPPKKKSPPMPASAIREKPPVFPLRGYFDNDDDMIANWKGKKLIIEFETWKEMIDSLARMRYNYIDLHDTLGRAEFWNWQYYKEKFPGYKTDLDLISKIIDYAHGKGMLVQVPMYLGWEFHHLPYDKICLGEYHEDWMAVYEYYLKETPLGKADLFLQRPRDPWWDKGYACQEEIAAGTDPGPLMTKMFNGLQVLVDEYRPGGKVICDLWAEGRDMWRRDAFNPSNEIDMLWADNGYAVYSEWPSDFKNHKFGIYVHAGYYLNHVMQDPYPERIKEVTTEAVKRGMTANYFVNGQDFKHFILNLEACGRAAWNPAAFNPEAFYKEWATRYFGAAASGEIINSLKMLHKANAEIGGFTKVMDMTDEIVTKLKLMQSEKTDTSTVARAMGFAEASLASAEQAAASVPSDARLLYDDQILFPARIYLQDLKLYQASAETMRAFDDKKNPATSPEGRKEAKARLEDWKRKLPVELKTMIDLLNQGSSWKKWEGWTKVENFRKITPPPDPAIVGRTVKSLH
ncbi:MAG TPA: glycosyl hydrolase 115 family protein, partial [bacterium]|nr:glycosyl hydrolase 115 family protein [bacterium]